MNSIISEGVQVSVETFYQPDYSNPIQSEFMFAYRITLENHNRFTLKLNRRNWQIFDSKMKGSYQMENLNSKQMFQVDIPAFEMIVPMKYN